MASIFSGLDGVRKELDYVEEVSSLVSEAAVLEDKHTRQYNLGYEDGLLGAKLVGDHEATLSTLNANYRLGYANGATERARLASQEEYRAGFEWGAQGGAIDTLHLHGFTPEYLHGYADGVRKFNTKPAAQNEEETLTVSSDYADGYNAGLTNEEVNFETDEELTDAFIDGYQNGQNDSPLNQDEEEELYNVDYDDLHVSADTEGHIAITGLDIVLDYPQASLLAERLFAASEFVQSQLDKEWAF